MKSIDNEIVEEDADIAETMVSYFSTVHTNYRGEVMPEMQDMTEAKLPNIEITPEMIEKNPSALNKNRVAHIYLYLCIKRSCTRDE